MVFRPWSRRLLALLLVAPAFAVEFTSGSHFAPFIGTDQIRMAYVSGGKIHTVDFSTQPPAHAVIAASDGAVVPSLSPDGKWIVYGKGPGGDMTNNISTKSSAWIVPFDGSSAPVLLQADSAHEPRFRHGIQGSSVVYSTLGKWGAWNGIGHLRSLQLDLSSTPTVLGDSLLIAGGSWYGGVNGAFAASGSDRAVMTRLGQNPYTVDTTLLYALRPASGGAYSNFNGRQACNSSIYPGSAFPDAMLSLDFGSAGMANDSILNGRPWGMHDILLLTRYDKGISRIYFRPELEELDLYPVDGYLSHHWDDPEWSNHPYFAVANLAVSRILSNGNEVETHETVLLVDLRDGSYQELARAGAVESAPDMDFSWPVLWIDSSASGVESESAAWLDSPMVPILESWDSHPAVNTTILRHFDLLGRSQDGRGAL